MKVKVIKANLDSYWYADNIGKVYEVEEVRLNNHSNLEYKVIGSELGGTKYFDKDDVEIINEESVMKREDKVNIEVTLQEAAQIYVLLSKVNGTAGFNAYKTFKDLVDPKGEAWNKCIAGKFESIHYLGVQKEFEAAIFDRKTPEQQELDKLMSQISDLQKQAEILQGMIGKSSK